MQEGFVHLAQHGRLTLDSKKIKGDLETFLAKENRFSSLTRKNPEASARLHHHLQVSIALTMYHLTLAAVCPAGQCSVFIAVDTCSGC
jgi:hypothetical protein